MQDLYMGARLTIHARVFELVEADPFTHDFMAKNAAVFWRSDPQRVLQAVQADLRLPCQVHTSCPRALCCPVQRSASIVSLHLHIRAQLYQRAHHHQGGRGGQGSPDTPMHSSCRLLRPNPTVAAELHPG